MELRIADPVGPDGAPVLVLGHSLGTAAGLWDDALPLLTERYRVVRWELPGHGRAAPATAAYRVEDLGDALVRALDGAGLDVFHYAGVSIGGSVGLDLCLRHGHRMRTAAIISTGARVDSPELMRGRATTARAEGMGAFVEAFRERWFAPTTPGDVADRVLGMLAATDPASYAFAAEALAAFDVWDAVGAIDVALLAIGGAEDRSVPFARSEELAARVPHGVAVEIPDAAHSLVAEQPGLVADALLSFLAQAP